MKYWIRLCLWATALLGTSAPVIAQTLYTGDGLPLSIEEEIRWRLNRGRFDSASENQLRGTAYSDVPASSGPLAPNQCIRLAAQHHTIDMATLNEFQHETIPGSAFYDPITQADPWDRMVAEGYSWNAAAENIAAGYNGAETVYVAWWKSTGHRQGMYTSGLREIAIGYVAVSSGYRWWYTMDLGSSGNTCFFTDTLFQDTNGNGVYDHPEGVSNVVVNLVVGTTVQNNYDMSSPVGGFAVPLTTISGGAVVQVVLSNANATTVSLSVPRDYQNLATLTLGPRERRVYGAFLRPTSAGNVGFRQLTPPPQLGLQVNASGTTLTWPVTGMNYELQFSTNFVVWTSLTNSQAGPNNTRTFTDARPQGKRFYRLGLKQP